jgi:hypothetical protein
MMQDAQHSFFFGLSDAVHRFLAQDRKIMQGQDRYKIAQGKWDDMYPTKSDFGVQSFQQWTRKFELGRPLFTLPALETDMPSIVQNANERLHGWRLYPNTPNVSPRLALE